jgi:hypothetical protein
MKVFLVNKKTKRRFEVISLDPAAGTVKLRGEFGVFTEPYSKERMKELGYILIKEDTL